MILQYPDAFIFDLSTHIYRYIENNENIKMKEISKIYNEIDEEYAKDMVSK